MVVPEDAVDHRWRGGVVVHPPTGRAIVVPEDAVGHSQGGVFVVHAAYVCLAPAGDGEPIKGGSRIHIDSGHYSVARIASDGGDLGSRPHNLNSACQGDVFHVLASEHVHYARRLQGINTVLDPGEGISAKDVSITHRVTRRSTCPVVIYPDLTEKEEVLGIQSPTGQDLMGQAGDGVDGVQYGGLDVRTVVIRVCGKDKSCHS